MNNLLLYRKNKGLSQQQVADIVGLSLSGYSRIENGKRGASIEIIERLADLYDVSVDTLLGRTSDVVVSKIDASTPVKTNTIPIVSRVRARFDPFDESNIIGELEVGAALVKMYPQIYAIEVNNDAMYPEIQIGDHAIIAPGTPVKDGDMGMICIKNDDGFIKRVHYSDDGIELISINDIYGALKYTKDQVKNIPVYILGKVIGVHRFYG